MSRLLSAPHNHDKTLFHPVYPFSLALSFLCRLPTRWFVPSLALTACLGPAYRTTLHGNEIWAEQATFTGIATIAAGVLAARSLMTWPLRRMGQLSYEIYLSHMFVVMALVRAFRHHDVAMARGWIVYPVAFVLVWALGESVSRLLSRPAARFLDAAAGRLLQKPNMWSSENPPLPSSRP